MYIIYALFLTWLALSGSYNAWQTPPLLAINGIFSAGLLVLGGWQWGSRGARPLTWPLIIFWLVGLVASVPGGNPASVVRLYYWAVLIAVYHLPVGLGELRRGARLAGWVIFPWIIFWPWENGNSLAFVIWGLFWLGGGGPAWSGLAAIALATTRSEGGILAVAIGAAAWAWLRWPQRREWLAGPIVAGLWGIGAAVVFSKLNSAPSFWYRVQAYGLAVAGFVRAPLIGHGLGTFDFLLPRSGPGQWHAIDPHNLLLNTLWETGLVGLCAGIYLVFRLEQGHNKFEPWIVAWLVTFASHSMVDLPLYSSVFAAVTLFLILGGLPVCREKITLAWPWPRRWRWPWPAPLLPRRSR